MATTYKDLGIPDNIANRLIAASKTDGLESLADPAGLRAWLADGNDLSDAVSGIGATKEKQVLEALAKLDHLDYMPGPEPEPQTNDAVLTVKFEVPVAQVTPVGYEARQAASGKIRLGKTQKTQVHLTPDEAVCFLQIREGLLRRDMRLKTGDPVKSNADVVRWLIGQIIDSAK